MRFSLLTSILVLTASVVIPTPVAAYNSGEILHSDQLDFTPSNITLAARGSSTSSWYTDKCKTIAGTYTVTSNSKCWNSYDIQYDLGCLCLSTLSDYCDANGISDYIESWIRSSINSATSYTYPYGSQPTCSAGAYTCPQGTINKDGSCSSNAASCGASRCAQSDNTCCSTGCSKKSGSSKCTGTGTTTCTSPYVLNNGLCCPSGYTGYTKACCPSGQTEDTANPGTCICTDSAYTINTSTQKCVAKCGTGLTWYNSAGICCGTGATPVGGVCTCTSSQQKYDTSLTPDACADKCSTGYTFYNTKCCKSYMVEISAGNCGCATTGYTDNGSACTNPCTSQQTLSSSGTCVNKCSGSLTWMTSSTNTAGMCCSSGQKACDTICCKTTETESNGHCCTTGSYWNTNTKVCTASSGKATSKRATFGISQAVILEAAKGAEELNLDLNLCPQSLSACPINPEFPTGQYECLDAQTDITSCGGCTSLGKGQDCGAIRGARFTGCEAGSCKVYSCRPGWERSKDGSKCVRK